MTENSNQPANISEAKGISGPDYLIDMFPDSPHFLGREIYYPEIRKKKRRRHKKPKLPDLDEIREVVHKFSEKEKYDSTRHKIAKYLKKYPHSPDLNALKAIQLYNDVMQGGVYRAKVEMLSGSLIKMAKALHNGGVSIFNVTWFINIYLAYIELIRERLAREYNQAVHHGDKEVRNTGGKVYQKLLKVPRLVDIKSNIKVLATLNMKLKGSVFITDNISKLELLKACEAVSRQRDQKMITPGKRAGNIVLIALTLSVMFSKIPILKNLVRDTLKSIPDYSRDLVLQKQMILNTGAIFDFQVAIASGNLKLATDLANTLFVRSNDIINEHLENAYLTKAFEVDPFIKAIWIAVEAGHLLDDKIAGRRLEHARQLTEILLGNRCRYKAAVKPAVRLQTKIREIEDSRRNRSGD